jgi:hypothetical protein
MIFEISLSDIFISIDIDILKFGLRYGDISKRLSETKAGKSYTVVFIDGAT